LAYKKYPNSKQFDKGLRRNLKSQLYLFTGEEEGEKDKIITKMIGIHLNGEENTSEYTGRYYLTDDRNIMDEFIAAAEYTQSSSMFSSKKIVILKNIDKLKSSSQNSILIEELFTQLPEDTVLIMTIAKNSIPAFIEKAFPENGEIIQFWKFLENDLFNYIQKSLNDKGLKPDSEAINTIIELTGNDIKKIDEAINMLYYSGSDIRVDAHTVKQIIGDTREITVFEFIDHLFSGSRKTLSILSHILDEGVADLLILNMILRQTDLIEKYYLLIDNHQSPDEALKKIGVAFSKPRKDKFMSFTKKIKRQFIPKIYPLIARTDFKIKSGQSGESKISNPIFELSEKILLMK